MKGQLLAWTQSKDLIHENFASCYLVLGPFFLGRKYYEVGCVRVCLFARNFGASSRIVESYTSSETLRLENGICEYLVCGLV